jgi:hypothetical protein
MDALTIWKWSLLGGAVVILIVAVLLIAIIVTARRIDKHALAIWIAGKNIAANTVSIWMLDRTNEVAAEILETAQSIDSSLKTVPGR